MSIKKNNFTSALLLLSLGATVAMLVFSDPFKGGPMTIIVFLAILFLCIFSLSMLILRYATKFLPGGVTPTRSSRYYSSISISTGAVFLLGLQTIGQLELIDILLVVCFELLINFYIFRRL
jgi:hypothetical protein